MDPIQPTPNTTSVVKSSSHSPPIQHKVPTHSNATDHPSPELSHKSQPNPYILEKQNAPPMPSNKPEPKVKDPSLMKAAIIEDQGPYTLSSFVSKYARSLPLRITVEQGHDGDDERHSIAAGDVYDIHFVKSTKVALLQDASGMTHTIPLNSAVQFGPIFDPNHDPKEAMHGFTFERISDVIAQKTLPKVIRATKAHTSSDCKSSVEQDEVFVVQKAVHTAMKKEALKVYSITKGEERLLEGDCLGGFSTDPCAVRLHLPEIIEHFSDEFPLQVQVIMGKISTPEDLPSHVTSKVSSLTGLLTETSLIASTYWGEKENIPEEYMIPIDIPADLPIEVRVIDQGEKKELDLDTLYVRTRSLFESYDPSKTRSIRISSSDLCTAVRKGFEREGIELQRPDLVYDEATISHPQQSPALTKHRISLAGSTKDGADTTLPRIPKPKPRNPQTRSPQIKQKVIPVQENTVSAPLERSGDKETCASSNDKSATSTNGAKATPPPVKETPHQKHQISLASNAKDGADTNSPPVPKPKPRNPQSQSPQIKQRLGPTRKNSVSAPEERSGGKDTCASSSDRSAASINGEKALPPPGNETPNQKELITRVETLEKELRELRSAVVNLRSQGMH